MDISLGLHMDFSRHQTEKGGDTHGRAKTKSSKRWFLTLKYMEEERRAGRNLVQHSQVSDVDPKPDIVHIEIKIH